MANEGNLICGLDPLPDNNGQIDVRPKVPILASINIGFAVFRGAPYQLSSGTVFIPDYLNNPTQPCAGSVVKLYDSGGSREVINLPVGTDGFADVTYRKDQRYQIVANGEGFPDDGSANGNTFGLTNEGQAGSTNGLDGPSNSSVLLNTEEGDPTDNTFLASFKVRKPRNLGGVDRTLVEGTINPACWQAW